MSWGKIIAAGFLFMLGCTSREQIPETVLPPAKMEVVLWDLIRADQFASDYLLPGDTSLDNQPERVRLYQQVFAIHGITSEEFKRSFQYYQTHPSQLKLVVDSLYARTADKAPTEVIQIQQRDSLLSPGELDQ
jgi:hypothetical protein